VLATRLLWLIAAALVLLAGCSSSRSASGRPSASALDLIGEWHVDARDAPPHTVLLLGADLEVWMPCGALDANWAADAAGQFVAIIYSAPDACLPLPAWLAKATSFTVAGSTAYLLDAGRQPLARLSRTSVPVGDSAALPAAPYPPVLDATLRARLSPPSALPAGVQPANGRDLIGRWLPAEPGADPKAYLSFATDGTWQSYDGCNSGGGPWRDTGGHIVAAAGAMPAVGCDDMTDLSQPLLNAAQVGITPDGTLELFDAQGSVVARLRR
jgi:heat shock protein HslJ